MIEHDHPEGEPTPTVLELYERKDGSAEAVSWATPKGSKVSVPTRFQLLPRGQKIISDIARRNAMMTELRGTAREEGVAAVIRAATELTPEQQKNRAEGKTGSKAGFVGD